MKQNVLRSQKWVSLAIRGLRSSLGETQTQFASRVGVALATLVRYETGAQRPKVAVLVSLARIAEQHRIPELAIALREGLECRMEEAERKRALTAEGLAVQIKELRQSEAEESEQPAQSGNVIQAGSEDQYTHRMLWRCAETQLRLTGANKQERSDILITALLIGDLAFEAYLNYIGESVAPRRWSTQNGNSPKMACSSTMMKLRRLVKVVHCQYPDQMNERFSSIIELSSLRKAIVHPGHRDQRGEASEPNSSRFVHLRQEINHVKASGILSDLYSLIEELHASFRASMPAKIPIVYAFEHSDEAR